MSRLFLSRNVEWKRRGRRPDGARGAGQRLPRAPAAGVGASAAMLSRPTEVVHGAGWDQRPLVSSLSVVNSGGPS
jgi:hypothetical protein